MTFTKQEMLQMLEKIKNTNHININDYINDVIENDIPSKSLKFINLYIPLKDLGVFNLIYSKRHKTPLFNNITKRNIDNYQKSICLGSLLTQMMCYVEKTKDDVVKHSSFIGATSITEALNEYFISGSFDKINEVYDKISELFKYLYNKDGDI